MTISSAPGRPATTEREDVRGEQTDVLAFHAIQFMLDGDLRAALRLATDFGPWQSQVLVLAETFVKGGSAAVRLRLGKLVREDNRLRLLMATYAPGEAYDQDLWTVCDLYDAPLASTQFVVPGLLPVGLSILAGRPKIGKSWLALQIAAGVALGEEVLGIPVEQAQVLYLALEDTPRRLRERLERQGVRDGADISFAVEWTSFDLGGLQELVEELQYSYRLVVIDTLARALGQTKQADAVAMNLLMSKLHRLAARRNVAMLIVDHHRKAARRGSLANPVDDILGVTAKVGVVDAALGLYRPVDDGPALLKVAGRDLAEQEWALEWDAEHCRWRNLGDAEAVKLEAQHAAMLKALRLLGRATLRELGEVTGENRSNLFRWLQALTEAGVVVREREATRVYYRVQEACLTECERGGEIGEMIEIGEIGSQLSTDVLRTTNYHGSRMNG